MGKCKHCNREFEDENLNIVASNVVLGILNESVKHGEYCISCFVAHCIKHDTVNKYLKDRGYVQFYATIDIANRQITTKSWSEKEFNSLLESAKILQDTGISKVSTVDLLKSMGVNHGIDYCMSPILPLTSYVDPPMTEEPYEIALSNALKEVKQGRLYRVTWDAGDTDVVISNDIGGFFNLRGVFISSDGVYDDAQSIEELPKIKMETILNVAYGIAGIEVGNDGKWK